jgi:hypothetical protein
LLWRWKSNRLRAANAFHPSLHFKPIGKPDWSARVSDRYRTVKKVLLICSHLQQFSKIISPPNRPLPVPQ